MTAMEIVNWKRTFIVYTVLKKLKVAHTRFQA